MQDFKQPEYYTNRELSLLAFNQRVLHQAKDIETPLLERLKFLCISSTNLDEFFEIRVSGLKQKIAHGAITPEGPDNMTAPEVMKAVSEEAHALVEEQYRVLNDILIPEFEQQNVRFIKRDQWSEGQDAWLRDYFENALLPVLSPLGLDPAHPFPRILNKSLNFIVSLKGKDAFGRTSRIAVVQAPRALPRVIQLPANQADNGPHDFVFLSSVIHAYVDELFPGMKVTGCYQFRLTRNSDLFVDEEEIDDLLRAMEGELASRRYGEVVRLEVADECPDDLIDFLLNQFQLSSGDLFRVNGPVNLNRLLPISDEVDRPDLKYPAFSPGIPPKLTIGSDLFDVVQKQDILLHHPFESFLPVIEFLRQAATDLSVVAIKQTLYRTGPDSAVVNALVEAAKAGKEVTVVIELRARFDEAANIELANRLQDAGAHVVYGVVGFKTHAKMCMVVRREGKKLRRYVHLGTGNYHSRTARIYTDYGLFTADKVIGDEVHAVFMQLTSLGKVPKLQKCLQSPFTLFDGIMEKIARETEHAQQGGKGRIIVKVNSLIEPQVIQALYAASCAGVSIDLIVRGPCRLRPGIAGVSENIRVRSVIGRFLEHTRVFYFENNGNPDIYCSSADWMERNLFRRVEMCFPIGDKKQRERVISELGYYLQDNCQAWLLKADGSYELLEHKGKRYSAQQQLLMELAESF